MKLRVFFYCLVLLAITQVSSAQIVDVDKQNKEEDRRGSSIIDDSTKQVYGPGSTRYTYESYIKYNRLKGFTIDTSTHNFHRFHHVPNSGFRYQDLGNIGTALNSIFPLVPDETGAKVGFTVYDHYYKESGEMKYYNSLSPYSKFDIIWGGQGRAITEAAYSRNINPRTNVGFEFKGYFIDKQIGSTGRGDRQAQGTYYSLFGSHVSENRKYVALAYFNRNRHRVNESGGVASSTGDPMDPIFFDDNRQVNLTAAQTSELRTNYHLYHQYEISNLLQVYQSIDRYKQMNKFNDEEQDDGFFPVDVVDSAEVRDRMQYNLLRHEIGVKGDFGKTFYNFYLKQRKINVDYKYLLEDSLGVDTKPLENFGGVNLRFGNDSTSYIEAFGEYGISGNYRLGGELRNSWFFGRAESVRNAPTYMQQAYRGSHNEWNNDFTSQITTSFNAGLSVGKGWINFSPSAGYTLRSNYIYFKQYYNADSALVVAPFQASGDISELYAELSVTLNFLKHFKFVTTTRFTNVSGSSANAISVPEIFNVSQLSYNNLLFDGNLELQIGLDFTWRSEYYAMGYDPAIMQYYIQEQFSVYSYPLVDAFINGRVNRGRWFLKLSNVTELIRNQGYFATPFYPGQSTILDFGIDWIFFD